MEGASLYTPDSTGNMRRDDAFQERVCRGLQQEDSR